MVNISDMPDLFQSAARVVAALAYQRFMEMKAREAARVEGRATGSKCMNVYEILGAAGPRMVAANNRRAAIAHVARSMLKAQQVDALRAIELTKAGVEVEHVGAEEEADEKEGEA